MTISSVPKEKGEKNDRFYWNSRFADSCFCPRLCRGSDMVKKERRMNIIDLYKAVKPCPFCGSEAIYVTFEPGYLDDSAIVFCNACKVSVKLEENDQEGFNEETSKKAVEAWNRRTGRKEE